MNNEVPAMDAVEIRAGEWILERDSGHFPPERRAALERWLSADARHREVYLRFDEAWRLSEGLRAWRPADGRINAQVLASSSRQAVVDSTVGQRRAFLRARLPHSRRMLAFAASVLVAVLGVSTWAMWPSGTAYSTAIGGYERVALDDGSVVQLNTNTRLRVSFTDRSRRVQLDRGEAYFEVAHDRGRPFIVQAGDRQIVAVGTQFAVRRESDGVRVSVTEGTVRLTGGEGSTPEVSTAAESQLTAESALILLPAGSVARLPAAGSVRVEHHSLPEVESELTWRTGALVFHNQALSDVVAEINRYNRRQFVIRDPALASLPFGGNIRATDPEALIDALRTLGIQADQTGNTVVLRRNSP